MSDTEVAEAVNVYFASIHLQDDGRQLRLDQQMVTSYFVDVNFIMTAIKNMLSEASETRTAVAK